MTFDNTTRKMLAKHWGFATRMGRIIKAKDIIRASWCFKLGLSRKLKRRMRNLEFMFNSVATAAHLFDLERIHTIRRQRQLEAAHRIIVPVQGYSGRRGGV